MLSGLGDNNEMPDEHYQRLWETPLLYTLGSRKRLLLNLEKITESSLPHNLCLAEVLNTDITQLHI